MHSSMRRREAATASRASTRRAAEEASRRPYNHPYGQVRGGDHRSAARGLALEAVTRREDAPLCSSTALTWLCARSVMTICVFGRESAATAQ